MFKAVAVSLPLVLLILDLYVLRRREAGANEPRARWTTLLMEKLPFVLVLIPVSMWAVAAKDFNESRVAWADIHLGERLAQSAYGIVFYLQKTLLPIGLSPYDRMPDDLALTTSRFLICMVLAATVTCVLFMRRRRSPWLLAAWLAYVVILLPNLGVVQFSQQLAADRYSYLGIMPIMAVVAAAIAGLWRRASHRPNTRPALVIALTALSLGSVYGSRTYARHWQNSLSLWQRVLDLDPDCAVAHCNLGDALLRENRTTEASRHFAAAIDLDPNFSFAYANFAALLVRAGRLDDAVFAAQRALAGDSPLRGRDLARAHAILGEAYAAQRRDDLAWHHTLLAKELGFAEAQKMIDYLSRFSSPPTTQPVLSPQN
jgi:Tfp pilus assembly protein PilF